MSESTLSRINQVSFLMSLLAIVVAAVIGVLGIWEVIPTVDGLLWKLLGSCGVVFVAAVLTNLAIGCYRSPGGG
jgi:hypothetical protein